MNNQSQHALVSILITCTFDFLWIGNLIVCVMPFCDLKVALDQRPTLLEHMIVANKSIKFPPG